MNILRSIVASVIVISFIVGGCVQKKQPQGSESSGTVPHSSGNVAEALSVTKRSDVASNFSWKDSTGKTVDLDSFRGKVTLINFWATWCGPCKRELPDLISLSSEFANQNVKFIGISTDRGPNVIDDVRSFVKEQGLPYQIVISNEDLEDAYGNPRAIPTTFIIDANGKIAQSYVGMRSKEFFAQAIKDLLK
jgi:thiol-disulfide isomerase/thioredoxin